VLLTDFVAVISYLRCY